MLSALQGDAASAAEALLSTQRESERQVAAAAAAALKTEVRILQPPLRSTLAQQHHRATCAMHESMYHISLPATV